MDGETWYGWVDGSHHFLLQSLMEMKLKEGSYGKDCRGEIPVRPKSTPKEDTCKMNELSKLGEDHQDPEEKHGHLESHVLGAEVTEGATVPSSSPISSTPSVLFPDILEEVGGAATQSPPQSPEGACPSPPAMATAPWSQSEDEGSSSQDEEGPSSGEDSEDAESSLQGALNLKITDPVVFLLLKYRIKEPTTKAEMLSRVIKEYGDHFPMIFSLASECLQLVFGVDVNKVDATNHTYVLSTTLGLTYNGMVSDGHNMPRTGLLVMLLGLILLEDDCAPEEDIWEALGDMEVYAGREHSIYGEPRELITKVWVREQYVVYRQVANSDPARYEFLWGPRAHAETSKLKVMEYLLRVYRQDPNSLPSLSEEADGNEEVGA
ncbi:melanoma-associated antigen 8 [Pteropus alecto]|uniref:melanoma-associated antigen 8 n=1 Tax=Pteropus alecto TaxID=9402 RepID=UPI0003F150C2|nr:melanoma-associated antigen 8 [Pteropus alecto]